jgi:hypothetical protein
MNARPLVRVIALGPAALLTLGVLLTAPETDGCASCGDIPPFVAARTELLIYDPPPPLPAAVPRE